MAYKLGFILSLFFVMAVVAFSGDLGVVTMIHNSLDAAAVTAAYQISINNGITKEISDFVYKACGGSIESLCEGAPMFGEAYPFKISREYVPLIMSSSPMTISVTRSTVIGYLND